MLISVHIEANSPKEIKKLAEALSILGYDRVTPEIPGMPVTVEASVPNVPAPVETTTPNVPAPVEETSAPEVVETPAPVESPAEEVDHTMVRALATELIKKNKAAEVNAIVKATGATSIGKITAEQIPSVYAQLKGLA